MRPPLAEPEEPRKPYPRRMPSSQFDPSPFASADHRNAMLEALRGAFTLDWQGIHGVGHWSRVLTNGKRLAQLEAGIDVGVIELFAWLHDSCRLNDGTDPEHGPRAALLAHELRGDYFELSDGRFERLVQACEQHTRGGTEASPTVMACWDADRLDLGRVGITPDPERLCTDAARSAEIISWALRRSMESRP
ncbi:MAG: hypothetical protein ACI8Y8_004074 [Planctomycetota bacterium]|jgi:uncharacterized protein